MTDVGRRQPALLHLVGSFHHGGSEKQALQSVRLLKNSAKYRVLLACLTKDGVLRTEAETLVREIPEYPLTSFYNWNACAQLRRFTAFLRQERIDIVQTHDFYTNVFGMLGASLARVPIRLAARRETTGVRTPLQLRVEHASYRLASSIVANAAAIKAQLVNEGVPAAKITVIHNGVDLARFGTALRTRILESAGVRPGNRVVTIVANMRYPVKDHTTFLRSAQLVASAVSDVTFVLVGEGELLESLKSFASTLGLAARVLFLGSSNAIAEVLAASDVCVLTSRAEGFPNAVLEYMAAGKPVVSTNVGGVPEMIIDGETGYIVPVGDVQAIADRVTALLEHPDRAAAFGRRGRQIIENRFSCEAQLMALETLYARLLSRDWDATNPLRSSVASSDPSASAADSERTERRA